MPFVSFVRQQRRGTSEVCSVLFHEQMCEWSPILAEITISRRRTSLVLWYLKIVLLANRTRDYDPKKEHLHEQRCLLQSWKKWASSLVTCGSSSKWMLQILIPGPGLFCRVWHKFSSRRLICCLSLQTCTDRTNPSFLTPLTDLEMIDSSISRSLSSHHEIPPLVPICYEFPVDSIPHSIRLTSLFLPNPCLGPNFSLDLPTSKASICFKTLQIYCWPYCSRLIGFILEDGVTYCRFAGDIFSKSSLSFALEVEDAIDVPSSSKLILHAPVEAGVPYYSSLLSSLCRKYVTNITIAVHMHVIICTRMRSQAHVWWQTQNTTHDRPH